MERYATWHSPRILPSHNGHHLTISMQTRKAIRNSLSCRWKKPESIYASDKGWDSSSILLQGTWKSNATYLQSSLNRRAETRNRYCRPKHSLPSSWFEIWRIGGNQCKTGSTLQHEIKSNTPRVSWMVTMMLLPRTRNNRIPMRPWT